MAGPIPFRRTMLGAALAAVAALPATAAPERAPLPTPVQRGPDDPLAGLDDLVQATATVGSGIALARQQIANGDLTTAVATLERVLIDYPQADSVLLLHAGLLCRLDDAGGARSEIAELRGHVIASRDWSEVTAACGPVARPGMGGRP